MSPIKTFSLERRIERLWYGDSAATLPLLPLAWLFRLAVAIRRRAYKLGCLASVDCGVPVIVIGNITVGGTGKTPLVSWLAAQLAAEGRVVGILTRGYGGLATGEPRFVTRDSDAREVGDEALLLARHAPARICVCADRVAGAQRLIAEAGVERIICDDGLQHYRLRRDFEIAVVDGERGLGNRRMLPAGPLREPPERLREVDFVISNGGRCSSGTPRFELRACCARLLGGAASRELREFSGRRVWAVAGIGNPARFVATLRDAGIDPQLVDVPDHGVADLEALRQEQPWPIMMTEKDAVKYGDAIVQDAWYVPVNLSIEPEHADDLMKQLRKFDV